MTFFIRTFFKYLLVPLGIIYNLFHKQKDEVLILMYHRVDDTVKKELAVSRRSFCWHMNYLDKMSYKVITMDDVYAMITQNAIKGKHVVISFDDGYLDYYTNAYPILKKYNFPSTLYLCPGYIGTDKKYWWDQDEENARIMNWQHIFRLGGEDLVEFGSHTMNHIDMDQLALTDMEKELKLSKKLLEDKLGRPVRHFAYPRGIYTRAGEEMIRRYYDTAVLISNGIRVNKKCSTEHIHTLKRIPVLRSDGRLLFAARLKGWLVAEEYIKRVLGRFGKSGIGS